MEYRRLGASDLNVSAVGLGTNNFGHRGMRGRGLDEKEARRVIHQALDLGVNFIDTADTYGYGASEEFIGRAITSCRHDILVATKFGSPVDTSGLHQGASRRWIRTAIEASLRRLRTDYIDLYQLHRRDPDTPILETLQTLTDLVIEGKIRCLGVCNLGAEEVANAHSTALNEALAEPICVQAQYNLLRREIEADILPVVTTMGLGLIPYLPLAGGLLTGKYRPGISPPNSRFADPASAATTLTPAVFEQLERLEALAAANDRTLLELAIGWLLSHRSVGSVIASASSPEQIRENVRASAWRASSSVLEELGTT